MASEWVRVAIPHDKRGRAIGAIKKLWHFIPGDMHEDTSLCGKFKANGRPLNMTFGVVGLDKIARGEACCRCMALVIVGVPELQPLIEEINRAMKSLERRAKLRTPLTEHTAEGDAQ